MYIRRDDSHLRFGRQARKPRLRRIIPFVLLAAILVGAFWRFESLQQWAVDALGTQGTPAPGAVELALAAEQAYQVGDLETAVEMYRRAVQADPDRMEIAFEFGRMLVYEGYTGTHIVERTEEVLALAQDAVERAPEDGRAHTLMCLALLVDGRYNEAVAAGLRAVDLSPSFAEAWAYLSMAYAYSGRYDTAFTDAERAIELNPDSVDGRRAMATALVYRGQVDAVIEQYQEALGRQPNLGLLYFELAGYYRAQGRFEEANQAYDQVLALDKNNAKAYTRKCATYFQMGQYALSAETCEQAVALDQSYPEAYQHLGRAQYYNRNYEDALVSLETCANLQEQQGLPREQQSIDCWYVRGLTLVLLDRCPEAWPLLTAALQMNPNDQQRAAIMNGMESCSSTDPGYDINDIPTPATPTPTEEGPITVF